MKKIIVPALAFATLTIIAGCKKDNNNNNNNTNTQTTLEAEVLTDFPTKLVNPNYLDIQAKAQIMVNITGNFITDPSDANLLTLRSAWVQRSNNAV